jgi:HPt (histidine-containing phosphotransfer) domain-containing protein
VTDDGQAIRFCVSDTGLGVAAEAAHLLFNPFSLGDSSYARKQQGAGLGLAVAKRVVEQAGGFIGFNSKPGEGAQFFFTLPISGVAPSAAAQRSDVEGQLAPPTGLTLLSFLRSPAMTDDIAHLLEPFGNRLVRAQSMAEAVERAGKQCFDVIIAGAGDADMLAAAPGVKAPLIAVLLRGDRAPSATDAVLRWPVETDQLYRALDEICEPGEDEAEPHVEPPAAIDAIAFSTLEKSVGVKTLVEILQCYIVTAEQLTDGLAQACADEKWDEAARLAQDIMGAAGGLGLAAITQAARDFARIAREGQNRHALRNAAQIVVGEHIRARQALIHLYPEVA